MKLTQRRLCILFSYSQSTGKFTRLVTKAGNARAGATAGYTNSSGYTIIMVDGVRYRASRLAWLYVKGKFPPADIDHKNTKRSDDRFINLRLATRLQNSANCRLSKRNTSGVKGVSWRERDKVWAARIRKNYKLIHLGSFASKDEARKAYYKASKCYFGEFARVN